MLLIFALLLAAAVADVAVESALGNGTSFIAAGQDLATGFEPEVVTLSIAGAAAIAGIVLAGAIGRRRRRGRTTRLRERRDQVSQAEAALESRRQMIENRLQDLQRNHDDLLAKRDELLVEVDRLRTRHDELEERVHERHREIAEARRELADLTVASATAEATGDAKAKPKQKEDGDLTVVPEVSETATKRPRR